MRAEEIQTHIRRESFQPFRVFLSGGSYYDVPHPEAILVTRREVVIAQLPEEGEIPERSVNLDPVHITRIEPLGGRRRRRRKTAR